MDLQESVYKSLCNTIDNLTHQLEHLPPKLAKASELMAQTLLSDHKILVCGNAMTLPLCGMLSSFLMNRHDHERPSLPAINLCGDNHLISAIARDTHYNDVFSKQIRALGQQGDLLIALSIDGNCASIIQAVQAAHDQEMSIIAIYGGEDGNIGSLLASSDIELKTGSKSAARVLEGQLVILNTLTALIDQQIFGFAI
ncbi:MAG: SIS domain-containing protein [Hahellaceae bacterium]|nr:SIS domain-containing protein [Hahellaceae bacterium]MCP5169842.1 SIS domain-containing protein [Hahellaceae bacterium]